MTKKLSRALPRDEFQLICKYNSMHNKRLQDIDQYNQVADLLNSCSVPLKRPQELGENFITNTVTSNIDLIA